MVGMTLLFTSCKTGTESESGAQTISSADITGEVEHWADSVVASMPLKNQVGQLFLPAIYASDDEATIERALRYVRETGVGGLVLLKGTTHGAKVITDTLAASASVTPFFAIDAEWGLKMRLTDARGYPLNKDLARTSREEDFFDYGREIASQCRPLGINMVLGPVLDVAGDRNSIMALRSLGSDPYEVATLGVAYSRGVESGGVISVAKHFPGHGSPSADTHKSLVVIERSLNELRECELIPFQAYSDQNLSAVMVGHLAVPAIDPDMLPAAASPVVIKDLLRDELGFRGLIITDALNMGGARGVTALDCIKAGADMIVAPENTDKEIQIIMDSIQTGVISDSIIRDRCKRILMKKYLLPTP